MDDQHCSKTELFDGTIFYGYKDEYVFNVIESNKDYYEINTLRKFTKYIPENSVVYDIGANIGNHSVYFSKALKAKKIYSFEPVPMNAVLLEKNIQENQISEIEVFRVAIGSDSKKVRIKINERNMGECKVIESSAEHSTIEVPVMSIDSMNLETPDVIKIDVEGYELDVLVGMKKTLSSSAPIIWIEITDHFSEIDRFLAKYQYELIDKHQFNHIYMKLDSFEEKEEGWRNFKMNIVSEYNKLVYDKWNLNKWLASEKGKLREAETKAETEIANIKSDKEELFHKLLSRIEASEKLEIEKLKYMNENLRLKSDLENLKEELNNVYKEYEIDRQETYNKILYHIEKEKQVLMELKALKDHYQLIESRYMRLRKSLPGRIGVKLWKLVKKLKGGPRS
nr:FkbM family methyltransferase [Aneurinibacillus sp. XH2]